MLRKTDLTMCTGQLNRKPVSKLQSRLAQLTCFAVGSLLLAWLWFAGSTNGAEVAQAKQVETTSLLVLAAQTPTTSASGPLSPTAQVSSSSRSSYYLLALETTVQSSQITLTELVGYRLQLQKPGEASPLVTRYSASAPVEVGVSGVVTSSVSVPNPGSNSVKLRSLFVISAPVTSASVPGSTKIETEADVVLRDNLNTLLWKDTLTWERLAPGAYSIPYSLTITDNLVSGRRELVRPELPDWAGELLAKSVQPELIALTATTDANFGSNQKANPPLTVTKRNPLALLGMGLLFITPALLILVHLFQTGQAPTPTLLRMPARAGAGTRQTQRVVSSKSGSSGLKITKPGLHLNQASNNSSQTLADADDAEPDDEDADDISDAEVGKVPATLAPVSPTPKVATGATGNDRPASLAQGKSTSVSVSVKPQVRDADADDEVELAEAEWDIEDEVEADEGEDEDALDLAEDTNYSPSPGNPGKTNRIFSGRLPTVPKPGSSSGSSPGDANYTSNGNASQAQTSARHKKGQGLVSVLLPKKLPGAKAAMSQAGALESGAEARVFEMLKAHGTSWLLADSLDINKQFALKSLSRLGGLAVSYSRKEASYMNNGASLDFLLEAKRGNITRLVAVEVDGPWHGLAKQQGRDKVKDAVLEKAKISVIRIPTGDISQASLQQAFSSLVSNPAVRFWPA